MRRPTIFYTIPSRQGDRLAGNGWPMLRLCSKYGGDPNDRGLARAAGEGSGQNRGQRWPRNGRVRVLRARLPAGCHSASPSCAAMISATSRTSGPPALAESSCWASANMRRQNGQPVASVGAPVAAASA